MWCSMVKGTELLDDSPPRATYHLDFPPPVLYNVSMSNNQGFTGYYPNGFPRDHSLRENARLEHIVLATPQRNMRELRAIDPSKPRLAAILAEIFPGTGYTSCVEEYRTLHEAGLANLIWEEDLFYHGGISAIDVPHPWDWKVEKRVEASGITYGPLVEMALEHFARGIGSMENKIIPSWPMNGDGSEGYYEVAKESDVEVIMNKFYYMNGPMIGIMNHGLECVPAEDIGVSDEYIQLIRGMYFLDSMNVALVLSRCPGLTVTMGQLARNYARFTSLVEEYNWEWAAASWEWEE